MILWKSNEIALSKHKPEIVILSRPNIGLAEIFSKMSDFSKLDFTPDFDISLSYQISRTDDAGFSRIFYWNNWWVKNMLIHY